MLIKSIMLLTVTIADVIDKNSGMLGVTTSDIIDVINSNMLLKIQNDTAMFYAVK